MRAETLAPALALLLAAAAAAPAEEPPELVSIAGALTLRRLPAVLSEPRTARQLDTGLTTSFVFTVEATALDGRPIRADAQVRVRYDLWDERYVVERWDRRGASPESAGLARRDLASWWRSLALIVDPLAATRPGVDRARVELLVVPFSQAEQRDAQQWLLRSFGARDGTAPTEGATVGAGSRLRAFYGGLLAASIGRRSLITYSWTVPVTTEAR